MNSVTVVGNVTRDPELRYTPGGKPVCKFGLAVNRRWQKDGEWVEDTSFFEVVAWGDLGENVAESIPSGARVSVAGRLDQERWENDGGEKRSKVQIVAEDVSASLRFATVSITRTSRAGSNSEAEPAGATA
jgi:single-strand DNA-binding protein